MNRLDRLSAILIQLQSKRIVKAQEIADRFEISLRTVYRDIRSLELAGIPIMSEAGIGYWLMKEYRLPPVHFTEHEAMAFVTAEKLVLKMTDTATTKNYQSGLFKIKAVLGSEIQEKANDVGEHIAMVKNQYLPDSVPENIQLKTILDAVLNKNLIKIEYLTNAFLQVNTRTIEPVGIYAQGNYWYLVAFCQLRNDYRNFRLDRIIKSEVLKERFQQKHPALQSFIENTSSEKNLTKVVIRFDRQHFRYLGDQHYYMGFVSQKDLGEQIEITFLSGNLIGFSVWFMYLGAVADIIEPVELKELVKKNVEKVTLRLNG